MNLLEFFLLPMQIFLLNILTSDLKQAEISGISIRCRYEAYLTIRFRREGGMRLTIDNGHIDGTDI